MLVPSLLGSALFQQERVRSGGNFAVQFRPSDSIDINITGLYSEFNADNSNVNYLAWGSNALGGGGTLTATTLVEDTAVAARSRRPMAAPPAALSSTTRSIARRARKRARSIST